MTHCQNSVDDDMWNCDICKVACGLWLMIQGRYWLIVAPCAVLCTRDADQLALAMINYLWPASHIFQTVLWDADVTSRESNPRCNLEPPPCFVLPFRLCSSAAVFRTGTQLLFKKQQLCSELTNPQTAGCLLCSRVLPLKAVVRSQLTNCGLFSSYFIQFLFVIIKSLCRHSMKLKENLLLFFVMTVQFILDYKILGTIFYWSACYIDELNGFNQPIAWLIGMIMLLCYNVIGNKLVIIILTICICLNDESRSAQILWAHLIFKSGFDCRLSVYLYKNYICETIFLLNLGTELVSNWSFACFDTYTCIWRCFWWQNVRIA